jgi:hypothetical protein
MVKLYLCRRAVGMLQFISFIPDVEVYIRQEFEIRVRFWSSVGIKLVDLAEITLYEHCSINNLYLSDTNNIKFSQAINIICGWVKQLIGNGQLVTKAWDFFLKLPLALCKLIVEAEIMKNKKILSNYIGFSVIFCFLLMGCSKTASNQEGVSSGRLLEKRKFIVIFEKALPCSQYEPLLSKNNEVFLIEPSLKKYCKFDYKNNEFTQPENIETINSSEDEFAINNHRFNYPYNTEVVQTHFCDRFIRELRLNQSSNSYNYCGITKGQKFFLLQNVDKITESIAVYSISSKQLLSKIKLRNKRKSPNFHILSNGNLLVTGGSNQQDRCLKKAELVDFEKNLAFETSDLIYSGCQQKFSDLSEHKVLVTGGYDKNNSAQILDLRERKFIPTGSLNYRHGTSHSTTSMGNGNILITGGDIDESNFDSCVNKAEIFDAHLNKFVSIPTLNYSRCNHHSIMLPNKSILIFGGYSDDFLLTDSPKPVYPVEIYIP